MIVSALLLLLSACVESAPPPDVGDCADYPAGVYEYGQIGIGSCLAGPADVAFVGDRLLVSNANPWGDFTGGSILSLDLGLLPHDGDLHRVTELDPAAVPMPSLMGDMDLAEGDTLLLATNKLSEGSRTREDWDHLWFLDVSDPAAPALAEDRGVDGAAIEVGADPTGVSWDAGNGVAYVVNRTDHSVALVDTTVSPAELLPPGGPARVLETGFADADNSGSRASFVTLEPAETDSLTSNAWTMEWSVGAVRVWVPSPEGLYRVNGNGEDGWERSNLPVDLDPEVSDGLVDDLDDPWFIAYEDADGATYGRMFFTSGGAIRAASEGSLLEAFAFEEASVLVPGSGWDTTLGGPAAVYADLVWYLFYDGGDGTTQSIGLAISADGANFARSGDTPVLSSPTGESFEDPYVAFDGQSDRWRMWFTARVGDDWSIGEAWSTDLLTWTDTGTRWAPSGAGAGAPAVQYYGGRFHLLYDRPGLGNDIYEAVSVDGTHWEPVGAAFRADTPSVGGPRRVAMFALSEGAFHLRDTTGELLPTPVTPGDAVSDGYNGFSLRVAAGQWVDPEQLDGRADAGVTVDAVHEGQVYLSLTEAEGVGTIAVGTQVGRGVEVAAEAALAPGAAGGWDAEQVSSPVVATVTGERVMYYAGMADGVTRIGRATSVDGTTWTADADPVLEPEADWESVGMFPTSITVGEDGALHLFYAAWDGGTWRVGEASSDDGVRFTRVAGVEDSWTFEGGALGDWDDSGARDAFVRWNPTLGVDQMWYAGTSGEGWQIGYAERVPGEAWVPATDADGAARPVIAAGPGSIGAGGLVRPVVVSEGGLDVLWYAGLDDGVPRVGRAVLGDPDRAWKDLNYPTLADTWGFSAVPENDEEAIALGVTTSSGTAELLGCGTLARDEARGFLYVGCELSPTLLVLDVRDDSAGSFQDLNYLDVESLVTFTTTSSASAGVRGMMFDPTHTWLWFLNDSPEAAFAVDLSTLVDDADVESVSDAIVATLPLPRGIARDEGVNTQANIGPGRMVLHPDGHHVFVTNFNNNSVSAFDLSLGAPGTLIAEATDIGENPYVAAVSPDGSLLVIGNYTGEVDQAQVSSTLTVLDADATSPTFLQPLAWIGNR